MFLLNLSVFLICFQNVLINCRENILLQGRYNFNHPPSVEEYNPLRVIINYNEEDTKGRATIEPNNLKSEIELISVPAEELIPPAPPKLITSNNARTQAVEEGKIKRLDFNEQKIPVTVIYDTEEKHIEIKPKLTGTSPTIQKGQINRQQKQLSLKESERYSQEIKTDVLQTKKTYRQRDPVVPILESENFLYAYRGDYRYG